tara:strand:+ start:3797 stop:4618 length:822 start_codon:yes stop_codon:yes gene_type:complete
MNLAESILGKLKTNIFKSIDKRYKKGLPCNLVLFRLINNNNIEYAVRYYGNITLIFEPEDEMIQLLEDVFEIHSPKLCSHEVNKEYIVHSYLNSAFSFLVFSNYKYDYDLRYNREGLSLCAFLFLKPKLFREIKELHISLICGFGMGKIMIKLAEELAHQGKYSKIKLISIDKPIGFYLSLGYNLENGEHIYEVPIDVKLSLFKNGKLIHPHIERYARIKSPGRNNEVTSYKNINGMRKASKSRPKAKKINYNIFLLEGIKMVEDGVKMYKNV